MKKTAVILLIILSLCMVSCRRDVEDENQPTSIPPAKKTAVPTVVPDTETSLPNPVVSYFTDFENGSDGYFAAFADYPRGDEDDYMLESEIESIPDINSMGYMLKGTNKNNDLLMYITKGFEALPDTKYYITIEFDIAINIPSGEYSGSGKPLNENVFIKTGASNVPLASIVDSEDNLRVNWDIGNSEMGGTEGGMHESIEKYNSEDDSYQIKHISTAYRVKSSEDGRIYIMIGVDSGVNELAQVYVDNIVVEMTEE